MMDILILYALTSVGTFAVAYSYGTLRGFKQGYDRGWEDGYQYGKQYPERMRRVAQTLREKGF